MTDSFMQNAKSEGPLPPEWVIVGESVLIRPYNTSGVVCFIGPTHFQVGHLIIDILTSTVLILIALFFICFN